MKSLLPVLFVAFFLPRISDAAEVTFRNDVMAVLSKAGCNAGACHGNQNGKGGFKLSLRGEDPAQDYQWIVRELAGRRINRLDPDASLLLMKPTAQVAHQGGKRFRQDSREYDILRTWLAAGAQPPDPHTPQLRKLAVSPPQHVAIDPDASLQLQVTATFADGAERDVTDLAVYETTNMIALVEPNGRIRRQEFGEVTILVRFLGRHVPVQLAFVPAREEFTWTESPANNYVDTLIDRKLRTLRMQPSELADDATFVRRVYLDALGLPPTAEEAREFVADADPDKRPRLIDRLLARPEFADHWALKWSDLLRNEEKVLDAQGVDAFHHWIRESVVRDQPIDQFVRELIAARGSTYKQPAANFWRANRDPFTRAENTARLFLGTRLLCAKCHNHPFERWTQDDYYSWAALFARVDYEIVENKRTDKLDNNEFIGEQIVLIKDAGEVQHARTGKNAAPAFLGDESTMIAAGAERLELLSQWLTSKQNRLFAESQANWIWYHVMGRGLVEPLDDFRETNPGVNPELLDALADDFAEHNFSLRHLVRRIMNSRTYQLSATPNATNETDQSNFSRAIVRRLTAEQLLDAQDQVLGTSARFAGFDQQLRAGEIPGVRRVRRRSQQPTSDDRFLMTFGKPERLLACECERSNETTLSQAFVLIGGQSLNDRLARSDNRLAELAHSELSNAEIVNQLYWSALGRSPTSEESSAALAVFAATVDRLTALQDIAWALLNAKEFVFRK